MNSQNRQAGFTAVVTLALLIVVVITGFAGYYVLRSDHNSNGVVSQGTRSAQSSSTTNSAKPVAKSAYGIETYSAADVTSSTDQKAIIKSVLAYCKAQSPQLDSTAVVAVSKGVFSDKNSFAISGGFAKIIAGCANVADLPSDGATRFLLRSTNGRWSVLSAGQAEPNCSEVDAIKIPKVILFNCYDEKAQTDRAPII
ncbi:hypothetical protein H7171_01415 [Candidatus Saccharibacteria bacterium]|nr:hypothetical protein [Candidatus Saccharibacteria bacterium]